MSGRLRDTRGCTAVFKAWMHSMQIILDRTKDRRENERLEHRADWRWWWRKRREEFWEDAVLARKA